MGKAAEFGLGEDNRQAVTVEREVVACNLEHLAIHGVEVALHGGVSEVCAVGVAGRQNTGQQDDLICRGLLTVQAAINDVVAGEKTSTVGTDISRDGVLHCLNLHFIISFLYIAKLYFKLAKF